MSSTAIRLLGLGMEAWRFFFLSSRASSRFWLGTNTIWLNTTQSAPGTLSTMLTRSTGILVLFTSILAYGRITEGRLAQSTSTRLYTLQQRSPMPMVSSSTLKLVIDTTLSRKFMEKKRSTYSLVSVLPRKRDFTPASLSWSCTLRIFTKKSRHFLLSNDIRRLFLFSRSEERRVGKECRSRWSPY